MADSIYTDVTNVITAGGYDLADLLHRIDVLYAGGRLTDEEYQQLFDAAADGADMDAQLPGVEERLSSLELRVAALEAGIAPTEPSDEEWPEWVKPTSKDTMYNKDDKVSCDGRRFICRKNNVATKPTDDSKSWEEQA